MCRRLVGGFAGTEQISVPPALATSREPGGTDSTSFSWIGLDGYGFMQDPLEYASRTHHSNMDLYDRVQVGDVMQGAALEAWFVYNTATRAEMMPRNPVPTPIAK